MAVCIEPLGESVGGNSDGERHCPLSFSVFLFSVGLFSLCCPSLAVLPPCLSVRLIGASGSGFYSWVRGARIGLTTGIGLLDEF